MSPIYFVLHKHKDEKMTHVAGPFTNKDVAEEHAVWYRKHGYSGDQTQVREVALT